MSIENLGQYFSTIEDPRCSGKIEHRLIDILVIAVCAVIACAESWDDIALYEVDPTLMLVAKSELAICSHAGGSPNLVLPRCLVRRVDTGNGLAAGLLNSPPASPSRGARIHPEVG